MELSDFLRLLLRRWAWWVVPMVLFGGAAAAYSISQPAVYTAKASTYFSSDFGRTANDLYQGANYAQLQLASFASLATQPIVLNEVISDLGLDMTADDLASQIQVSASTDTVIVDIRVDAASPQSAAQIANKVNQVLGEEVSRLSPKNESKEPTVNAVVVSQATPPTDASGPQTRRNTLIGLFAGLILGLVLALLRDRLDTRVLDADDVPESLTVLGSLPSEKLASEPGAWTSGRDAAALPQEIGRLQANLRFASVDKPIRSLLVTSSMPGEGKSTVAIGLAISMAESGVRTLLIDADLRRPKISSYLDLEGAVGLADVLVGSVEFDDVVQDWGVAELKILAAGSKPPNPKLLLESAAMESFIEQMIGRFDVVIVDSPPLLAVVDPLTLSNKLDGVVLVVGRGRVRRAQVTESIQSLTAANANLLGAVLNHMPMKRDRAETYGY